MFGLKARWKRGGKRLFFDSPGNIARNATLITKINTNDESCGIAPKTRCIWINRPRKPHRKTTFSKRRSKP